MDDERDEQIYKLRLAGVGIRTVAARYGLTVTDVNEVCDRKMPKVDNRYRARCVAMDLEAMERLQGRFLTQALNGDTASGHLCLKIMERRAHALGTDAPLRVDPIQLTQLAGPHETSTENLRRIFKEARGRQTADPPSVPN